MGWKLPFAKKHVILQTSRNDAVRESLAMHGDDGVAVRHVVHYAYPAKGADLSTRPQIVADLKSQRFEVRDAAAENGLVFEHHCSVAPGQFDALTDALEGWFARHNWGYDGWECAVVAGKPR
jgi:hypothetical protein